MTVLLKYPDFGKLAKALRECFRMHIVMRKLIHYT